MNYEIIDHGNWRPYTKPAVTTSEGHPLVPAGTLFCKREGDEVDWYDYSRDPDSFEADSVLVACLGTANGLLTQAVFTDPSFIFPQNSRLIEVRGFVGTKPHNVFGNKIYDAVAKTFSEVPAPVKTVITYKKDIWLRATDAEADIIEDVLRSQTNRKQRIFGEAQYLDHADALFSELFAGFVSAFGNDRAKTLLAES